MMTQDEQQVAVAKWCGWEWKKAINSQAKALFSPKGERTTDWFAPSEILAKHIHLPNYPSDLNAIHEAEGKLDAHQILEYIQEMQKVTTGASPWSQWIHVTAAQRCEALCRVLWPERWKE